MTRLRLIAENGEQVGRIYHISSRAESEAARERSTPAVPVSFTQGDNFRVLSHEEAVSRFPHLYASGEAVEQRKRENEAATRARYETVRKREAFNAFFRRHARYIAVACYVLVVFVACWFAFQLGRGVL